jgi:hypothetical protein
MHRRLDRTQAIAARGPFVARACCRPVRRSRDLTAASIFGAPRRHPVGKLVAMPMSELRRLALLWQDEERAFQTVLEVLREGRRFDLVLKLDTFLQVRRRKILRQVFAHVQRKRDATRERDLERRDEPDL